MNRKCYKYREPNILCIKSNPKNKKWFRLIFGRVELPYRKNDFVKKSVKKIKGISTIQNKEIKKEYEEN